jgi:hypothetical protein
MIIKYWNIGHCQMAWDLRQNPKIVDVFAKFYNVKPDELLVSFDSSSFHMPPEITGDEYWTNQYKWYHTDQSYTSNHFKYLQSWITALDVNEGDATFSFLEKSHLYHKEFAETFNIKNDNDWYQLTDTELNFYKNKGCYERQIICPKGSLVLWDGRTIHCGLEPNQNRKTPNFRCISYLCYCPRSYATEEDLCLKQEVFLNNLTTSHHPCIYNIMSPCQFIDVKEEEYITKIDNPKLTELGYKLAGFM